MKIVSAPFRERKAADSPLGKNYSESLSREHPREAAVSRGDPQGSSSLSYTNQLYQWTHSGGAIPKTRHSYISRRVKFERDGKELLAIPRSYRGTGALFTFSHLEENNREQGACDR